MRRRLGVTASFLGGSVLLAGCAVQPPTGPTVMALPGGGKSLTAFQQDDYACRNYASQATAYASAGKAGATPGTTGAVLGTLGGAALGAALGAVGGNAGAGAAIGGGAGLLGGASIGSQRGEASQVPRSSRNTTSPTPSACIRAAIRCSRRHPVTPSAIRRTAIRLDIPITDPASTALGSSAPAYSWWAAATAAGTGAAGTGAAGTEAAGTGAAGAAITETGPTPPSAPARRPQAGG